MGVILFVSLLSLIEGRKYFSANNCNENDLYVVTFKDS